MRIEFTLGLAALALSFGIAGAADATVDLSLQGKSTAPENSLVAPQGGFPAGLSALTTQKEGGPNKGFLVEPANAARAVPGALMRPAESDAWRDGFVGQGGLSPRQMAVSSSPEQTMSPQGLQANPKGFSALKASAGLHGESDRGLENIRSNAAASVPDSVLSFPSK
jgi:hypothetical protein